MVSNGSRTTVRRASGHGKASIEIQNFVLSNSYLSPVISSLPPLDTLQTPVTSKSGFELFELEFADAQLQSVTSEKSHELAVGTLSHESSALLPALDSVAITASVTSPPHNRSIHVIPRSPWAYRQGLSASPNNRSP